MLPIEIKNIIASFLDDRARRFIRTMSTEWFNIINYDDFTVYFASPSTIPDIVQTFSRYSKQIGLQFEKTISIDNNYTILASLTNLTRLEIEPRYSPTGRARLEPGDLECFTALTALKKLTIEDHNITPYIIRYFPDLTHITIKGVYEYLSFYGQSSRNVNVITKLGNLDRVRELDISDNHQILAFDEESVAKLSNVSRASISGYNPVSFPFSKLPNMESLTIANSEFDDFSTSTKLTYLSVSVTRNPFIRKAFSDQIANFHPISALEHLQYLELTLDVEEDEYSFLSKLTSLEDLIVQPILDGLLTGQFLQCVNSSKLTKLVVTHPSSLESISHLTSLQHLDYQVALEGTKEIPFKLTNVTSLIARDIMMAKCSPNLKSLEVVAETSAVKTVHEREVLASLSQLESLELFKETDNVAFQVMCGLTRLTRLELSNLGSDDATQTYNFESLTALTDLKELELNVRPYGPSIKHNGLLLPTLQILTRLERLSLFYVGVGDDIIQALESLPNLKHLTIKSDREELDELRLSKLTNLQTLRKTPKDSSSIPKPWLDCKLIGLLPYLYNCWGYK